MSHPPNDWDDEERDAIGELRNELAAIRARHASDPPIDLLRAAKGDALPDEVQEQVSNHLAGSAWSRALVDGAEDAQPSLSRDEEDRLLARVQQDWATRKQPATTRRWVYSGLAVAAVLVLAVIVRQQPVADPVPPAAPTPQPTTLAPTPAPAPVPPRVELPLDKPDVKLSPGAFTYRGPTGGTSYLADLKAAFDAYRQNDYARADREFESIQPRYPDAVEIHFYRGVSRLWLGDVAGATQSFAAAERIAEPTFAADVAWFGAIADQRAGRLDQARARLTRLCQDASATRRTAACDAIVKLR